MMFVFDLDCAPNFLESGDVIVNKDHMILVLERYAAGNRRGIVIIANFESKWDIRWHSADELRMWSMAGWKKLPRTQTVPPG